MGKNRVPVKILDTVCFICLLFVLCACASPAADPAAAPPGKPHPTPTMMVAETVDLVGENTSRPTATATKPAEPGPATPAVPLEAEEAAIEIAA